MDLANALKAGIIPGNSTAVEIILTAYKEGLGDILKKQIRRHHEILKRSKNVAEARTALGIKSDFSENEIKEIAEDLRSWERESVETQIETETNILGILRRKKIYEPISNNTTDTCYKCDVSVSSYNIITGSRVHHCRSCGRIFCNNCSKWNEIIPDDLVDYMKKTIWVKDGTHARVCENCKGDIVNYRKIEQTLKYFEIVAYPINLCIKASTICKEWREGIKYYLSYLRNIQDYFPTTRLTEKDIKALESNRKYLQGHSKWVLQFLKIKSMDLENYRNQSCKRLMCDKYCNEILTPYDSVIILNSSLYNMEVKLKALDILVNAPITEKDSIKDLSTFLPIEEPSVQDYILQCPNLFSDVFLSSRINDSPGFDIFRNKLILANKTEACEIQECLRLISLLDNKNLNLCELSKNLQALNLPFVGPFGKITKFDHEITIKKSKTMPIIINYFNENGDQCSFLYKKEDIRKDSCIVALVRIMHNICEHIFRSHNHKLAIYRVVPTSKDSGFIEIIQNALTIHDILLKGSISNYLSNNNKNKINGDIITNYTISLAFWTVITYILGVGDRHSENIMIREDGSLFHVDYGYVFCTLGSAVKIDGKLIEGLGGLEMYEPFKKICCEIFMCLRKNLNLILSCLTRLAFIDPSDKTTNLSSEFIQDFVISKFLFGQTEEECCYNFCKIIDSSRDNIISYVSDTIHSTVTKVKFGWFTSA